jgi:hypothetical protein
MDDAGDRLEHRPGGREGGIRAGGQDGERAVLGALHAAGHRRVQIEPSAPLDPPLHLGGECRRHGAAADHDRTRRQRFQRAGRTQHLLDLGGVEHHQQQESRIPCGLGRACGKPSAAGRKALHRRRIDVVA